MILLAYATYAAAARNGLRRLAELDESALVGLRRWHVLPWGRSLAAALTRAGDTRSWILHGLVLQLALGPDHWHATALLVAGALTGTAIFQILKRTCRRPRPRQTIAGFDALLDDPDCFSFPSGHTTVAFAVVAALAAVDPTLAAAELFLAVSIGLSRVYLGAHYPLDVAAGAVLGSICGFCGAAAWAPFLS